MRAGTATQHERLLRLFRRNADKAEDAGLTGLHFSGLGDGSSIEVHGRRLVNFGHCSYLGLSTDPRLKQGAVEAIERFGPHYSSSQVYASVDLYSELEDLLAEMTGCRSVVLPPTTTLGHLACLPTLVSDGDAVILDSQSHASLQLTIQVLAGRGISIRPVAHNDASELERAVATLTGSHRTVWYIGDGVYSMFGDVAPLGFIAELMGAYDNLHVYLDDAHGFSWQGESGRGHVLSRLRLNERMVVAAGLGKAFGSGGAALFFGDPAAARTVAHLGGPMTFSGPVQPPILGANIASAHIHLSPEIAALQQRMADQIALVSSLLASHRLPAVSWSQTPIWLVRVGDFDKMLAVTRRMVDDGFYLNPSAFPAVPVGMAGLRFTHSLHNRDEQIAEMIARLAHHMGQVVGDFESMVDLTELEAEPPERDSPTRAGSLTRPD
ncbi:MAG TPA: aminotransferase class I/II-fold pyridoxal phosphate-dependent enzyme [Acidimicrobiia bacterium]|nr:aminotransferase class I/II-fold pyridoxal phosphate-dependent enzyme [Acidimicrobiia bacterium]